MNLETNRGDTTIEQRKHQRFALKLPLELVVDSAKGPAQGKGHTRNISSSGVLFTSDQPLRVGEAIEYILTFPKPTERSSDVRLRCIGKVVRSEAESAFAATLERYEFMRA